jgi:hypothetical protein
MTSARLGIPAILSLLAIPALACGNSPSGFDAEYGEYGAGNAPTQVPSASTYATPVDAGAAAIPPEAACRTGSAQAVAVPLHLIVVLDRSGSMCEYVPGQSQPRDCGNPNSKWQQTRYALQSFFGSPQSNGMNVSLVAFPYADNGDYCNPNHYVTPAALGVPLPDFGSRLLTAIDSNPSSGNGATPTRDAYLGAIQIAQTIKINLGNSPAKVAILVATDGVPAGCNDTIQDSANLAASIAYVVPTYVLGVGTELQALNTLAYAGGTQAAFIANTTNPAMVGQQVTDSLNKIRTAALGCEYQVPAAPAGQSLDPNEVNVEFSNGLGHSTVPYSQGCATGVGWQYDNPAAPRSIRLCGGTCSQVSADASGRIDLVFGCATVLR